MKPPPTASRFFRAIASLLLACNAPPFSPQAATAETCVPQPSGLVGWWRAEGNPVDDAGGNNGTIAGTGVVGYAPGVVGQAFVFDGTHRDRVDLGNPTDLQLQDFTIEAWVKRSSPTATSFDILGADGSVTGDSGFIFGYGRGGYCFAMISDGRLTLSRVDVDGVATAPLVTDTNWHHLAVTLSGTNAVFYVDGAPQASPPYVHAAPYTFDNGTCACTAAAAIGSRGDARGGTFFGMIDELAIYNRPLSAGEIQAVYSAGAAGKCLGGGAPEILSQPADQTVVVGRAATFSVTALRALTYQWRFNETNILAGETGSVLVLTNVQFSDAGEYSVLVSNDVSGVISSNAVLKVTPPPPCVAALPGLVGWWRGEGNPDDAVSANNGTIAGTGKATYGPGVVGQAFVFDGTHRDRVNLGNPAALQLQDFTIEAWVKRSSSTATSLDILGADGSVTGDSGFILGYGRGGYCFAMISDGRLTLSRVDVDGVATAPLVTDTKWHHLAVTLSGTNAVFYVDGAPQASPPYVHPAPYTFDDGTCACSAAVAIGSRGDARGGTFLGMIDEMSVYNRPLTADELNAIYLAGVSGKCPVPGAPELLSQPADQAVVVGGTATFHVTALRAFTYQWRFNETNLLAGRTGSSLVLSNVQFSDAGEYSVIVSNAGSAVISSNAVLKVIPPPPCEPAPAGLVAWWRAEGNAKDSAGLHNGTTPFGIAYAPGRVGQAFSFNGTSSRVSIPDSPDFQLNSLTIEGWFYPRVWGGIAILRGDNRAGLDAFVMDLITPGKISFGFETVLNQAFGLYAPLQLNQWQHVAATWDGGSGAAKIYVNGALAAQTNTSLRPIIVLDPRYSPAIGIGNVGGSSLNFPINGLIDEISIYSRPLGQDEILAIYNAAGSGKCPILPAPVIEVSPLARFPGDTNLIVIAADGFSANVTLDGSKSSDVDDTTLYYFWYQGTSLLATTAVTTETLGVGTHEITLSLNDGSPEGTNSASVTVEVITPAESVGIVMSLVDDSALQRGTARMLTGSLKTAADAFGRGQTRRAIRHLVEFQNKVAVQVAPVNATRAGELIDAAQTIIDTLLAPSATNAAATDVSNGGNNPHPDEPGGRRFKAKTQ
jgi:hypothetical protein